jgi:micrococcal nuclease
VVDGDTLRVRPLTRTLRRRYERLVGIDTPETNRPGTPVECGGPEATAGLTRLAEARPVRLRTDPFQDTFDRYGRLLAYAKLRGGPDLALTQLRRGWAEMYAYAIGHSVGCVSPGARSARRGGRGAPCGAKCGGDFHGRPPRRQARPRYCAELTPAPTCP